MAKFDIDEALLRKLAQLLQETGLTEIEYENNGQRIRVNRGGGQTVYTTAPAGSPAPAGGTGSSTAAPLGSAGGGRHLAHGRNAYLAAEPGADPFVKVGDRVKKGQTLLIIEAMKVMNPIAAPEAGVVEAILISDGQPVEYGEPMLVLR
jgi:Biotin carboxyl carrier protein